mgnify:FL=1
MRLLQLFKRNKERIRNIKYKSSLEDISKSQVILIYGKKHLVMNIDHNYVQTLSREDNDRIGLFQIELKNYIFPKISREVDLKKVLVDYKMYNKNYENYAVADSFLIEAGL